MSEVELVQDKHLWIKSIEVVFFLENDSLFR